MSSEQTQLIFLHGWGQSKQVWYQQFENAFQTTFLDLPGHGDADPADTEEWLSIMEEKVLTLYQNRKIILIGWSLGGQLAIQLENRIRQKASLLGLVLVSTTPCFRQQKDWQPGCEAPIWQGFTDAAAHQDMKLMQRFFQMMLHGDVLDKSKRIEISRSAIDKRHQPSFETLKQGLSLLSELDLRNQLNEIKTPTLVMHGMEDIIVPVAAGQYLAEHISHSEIHLFQECGHAPFLTHHAQFNRILEQWCKKLSV